MITRSALFRDGEPVAAPDDPAALAAASRNGGLALVDLEAPTEADLGAFAAAFGLHPLAVEDALEAHQRPKLERYGDTLFCVLRPARYVDATESVVFAELQLFAGPGFVVTVCHDGEAEIAGPPEPAPDALRRGALAVLHALVDRVVDDYVPVVQGLENDVDEIEEEVFGGGRQDVSRRIYELSREVIAFARAVSPLPDMLAQLIEDPGIDEEQRRLLRDVQDHAIKIGEHVSGLRELLTNILNVNLTIETKAQNDISIAQNEEVKRISAWAAILFAPTLVGTIYGMNFRHMPELRWAAGYPLALVLMLAISVVLYLVFKRRGWI